MCSLFTAILGKIEELANYLTHDLKFICFIQNIDNGHYPLINFIWYSFFQELGARVTKFIYKGKSMGIN